MNREKQFSSIFIDEINDQHLQEKQIFYEEKNEEIRFVWFSFVKDEFVKEQHQRINQ